MQCKWYTGTACYRLISYIELEIYKLGNVEAMHV